MPKQSPEGALVGAIFGSVFVVVGLMSAWLAFSIAALKPVRILLAILCSYGQWINPHVFIFPSGPQITGPIFWVPDPDEDDAG
jgi:hypothetical protein